MSIKLVDYTTPSSSGESKEKGEEAKIRLEDIPPMTQSTIGKYVLVIVEVHKLNLPWGTQYIVACRLKDGNYTSPIFHVYCTDAADFQVKIAEEIKRYEAAKLAGVRP